MRYDKNEVYEVNFEGVDHGLFIGRENKYYDALYKYWCFLRFTDEVEENKRQKEEANNLLESEKILKRLKCEKAYHKYYESMVDKLLSVTNDLMEYIKDNKDRE